MRPDRMVTFGIPQHHADVIVDRLRPLVRVSAWDTRNFIETLMLSCYGQGAMDALNPAVQKLLTARSERTP